MAISISMLSSINPILINRSGSAAISWWMSVLLLSIQLPLIQRKITAISQLPDGARVAVPNDPTNLGRSLLLLEQQGLITLKEGVGLLPTALDIVNNPKKLKNRRD